METIKLKVFDGGRVTLPASVRRDLGIQPGDTLLMEVEGDELRLRSLRSRIRHAQEIVRENLPQDVSLVDDLISQRRADARNDP